MADFGLSRELLLRDYYRSDGAGMTPVPVRWLAPESLEASVFTTMTDVVRTALFIRRVHGYHGPRVDGSRVNTFTFLPRDAL